MAKEFAVLLLLVLMLTSFLAVPLPAKAEPKTVTVPDDYHTINAAIGNATAGTTIFVRNGVYRENVYINKPLSLIGEDSEKTVIVKPHSSLPLEGYAVGIFAESVMVSGFTIKDASIGIFIAESGLYPNPSQCRIIGNKLENNSEGIDIARYGGGNHVVSENIIAGSGLYGISASTSNNLISDNNIVDNGGLGISLSSSDNVTVTKNNITGNGVNPLFEESDTRGGLNLQGWGPYYVYGNNITNNQGYGVQFAEGCSDSVVYQNNIVNNTIGVNLLNFPLRGDATIGLNNKVYLNNFVENSHQAFVEREWSGNATYGNTTDIVSWDSGAKGNYWSDYQTKYPNSTEVDASGIGATPYVIDENNVDHYPLFQPVNISEATPSTFLTLIPLIVVGAVVVAAVLFLVCMTRKRKPKD